MRKEINNLNRILSMIVNKKIDEAEKQIESLKPSNEYEVGYLKGLKGIIYYLRKPVEEGILDSGDPEMHLKSIRETLRTHYLSREEEGYFTAWIDFLSKLSSSKKSVVKKEPGKQPG